MPYAVKEIYYTLQGEGVNVGRPAVFLRFAGCNLWSGREAERASAACRFCDTDFVGVDGPGGGSFPTAALLADAVDSTWPSEAEGGNRFVVCTGGEPLLQLDSALVDLLQRRGFQVAVETNGTVCPPIGLDWVCVSPKSGVPLSVLKGDELKLVFPQPGAEPSLFEGLQFDHFLLQPMDGPEARHNTELAVDYCRAHPKWRLSLQTHKLLGIP